jgi:hypothetical protein
MLIALPNQRRATRFFALQPIPLALLTGLLMGLFGALIWMDDHRPVNSPSNIHNRPHKQPRHSVIERINDIPLRETSHGTLKQQLVEPFTLHPNLAGISVATLQEGERIEQHVHKSMYEFFYILEGTLMIHDDDEENGTDNTAALSWKECSVGCFYQGVPAALQEFRVKPGQGPVRMIVYQLTTAT